MQDVTDKVALLRRIAARLDFPAWFGENWDALEDCLTDLSWRESDGNVLVVEGFQFLPPRIAVCSSTCMISAAQFWAGRGKPFFAVFIDPERALALADLYQRAMSYKLPVSVLVVVHTADLEVLPPRARPAPGLLAVGHRLARLADEPLEAAAAREVPGGNGDRRRGGPAHALEPCQHLRDLSAMAPSLRSGGDPQHRARVRARARRPLPVAISPEEHTAYCWLPWREAAAKCFTWSNRDAIRMLR